MLLRFLALSPLVLATIFLIPAPSRADNLGVANDYNLFVFHDWNQTSDTQGKVAVGGNATFTNFSVASSLPGNSAPNLIVGGNATQTGGTVNGSAIVGGDAFLNDPTITGYLHAKGTVNIIPGGSINGGVTYGTTYTGPTYFNATQNAAVTIPIDFATVEATLQTDSSYWGSLAANGNANLLYSTLTLSGTSHALNIFNITAAQLKSTSTLVFNVPSGSTALINIDGSAVQIGSFGITTNGMDPEHVLYNTYNATTVNIQGVGLIGSLLAPNAAVDFISGDIDGTLVADSLIGNGESHLHLFGGNLPTPVAFGSPIPVPVPASAAGGVALLSLLALRRKFLAR